MLPLCRDAGLRACHHPSNAACHLGGVTPSWHGGGPSPTRMIATRTTNKGSLMRDDYPRLIALASPKGGSGKTTATILLAGEFANAGLKTLIIDADPQASALSSGALGNAGSKGRGGEFRCHRNPRSEPRL